MLLDELRFLPQQRFECAGCTKCCRGWRIRVDAQAAQRLIQARGPETLGERDGVIFARKRPDGSCVFLEQSRCSVHALKPDGCRQFPFRLTRTPDGVFVGVSFYCSSVQANKGQELSNYGAELLPLTAALPLVGDEPLPVHSEAQLPWAAYRRLEDFLRQLGPDGTGRALWALSRLRGLGTEARLEALLAASQQALEPPAEPFALVESLFTHTLLSRFGAVNVPYRSWAQQQSPGMLDEALLHRYFQALLFRKFLVTRRALLDNLAGLHLLPGLLRHWGPEGLDGCEYHVYTHGNQSDAVFASAAQEFFWASQ